LIASNLVIQVEGKVLMANKKVKKNYGVDLTFWSPKSVSIACLVGGDNRLEQAHRQSVSRTIDFLEEHYAGCVVDREWVQTKNLVVLKQHHIEFFQLRGYTKEQLAAFSKGGEKSCNRVPVDATDEYWRQCAEGGGLPPTYGVEEC